ncbi:unnamed protein product [Nesidiocoris tenuis]|uniref:Uncharacterized protein n=1 Tax=Nesidiocoris tenuis TaxID=355587 RepID=A0A6H5GGA1_9HEMI|nr:unnamed protein product [Nesidiocoris tenuis]
MSGAWCEDHRNFVFACVVFCTKLVKIRFEEVRFEFDPGVYHLWNDLEDEKVTLWGPQTPPWVCCCKVNNLRRSLAAYLPIIPRTDTRPHDIR